MNNHTASLRLISFFLLNVVFAFCFTAELAAQRPGDLLVTPTRVIFDETKRNEVLGLTNIGTDTATYELSFIQYRMLPSGQLEKIAVEDSGMFFGNKLIRFFPKQVTLAPNETQNVRLQVTKPAGLPIAEYRTHLYFRSVARQTHRALAPDTSAQELSININAVPGVSIPLFVRHGDVTASAAISHCELLQDSIIRRDSLGRKLVNMRFQCDREGTKSIYGSITITHVSPVGEETIVGKYNGVAVYTPLPSRFMYVTLKVPEKVSLHSGHLSIVYDNGTDIKREILASTNYSLDPTVITTK